MPTIHPLTERALFQSFIRNDSDASGRQALAFLRAGGDLKVLTEGHPLGDDWRDFMAASARRKLDAARGHVYLMTGPSHGGLFKLGKTAGNPSRRLRALNNAAVLLPLRLVTAWSVHDRHWVEAEAHRALARAGVGRIKEFFDALPDTLAATVEEVVSVDRQRLFAAGVL